MSFKILADIHRPRREVGGLVCSLQATTGPKAEKLSALIPLLRKNAGEFVFGSVNKKVQTNYKKLVRELQMRFWTVESERGYRLKWTELRQSPGQSVEE